MIEVFPTKDPAICTIIHLSGYDTRGSDICTEPNPHRILLTLPDGVYSIYWADKKEPYVIKEEVTPL